jgi:RNA polymerase sigma factor (sigma-70 family)
MTLEGDTIVTAGDSEGRDKDWLAERFQEARPRLKSLAMRMTGASGDAEDAVQEAWIRLSRSDASLIENLGGWLTTVVARVCLDQLRRRKTRAEDSFEGEAWDLEATDPGRSPEAEAVLADSVEQAMLLVMDRLSPAERVAFVLHDFFEIPFVDIANILERSEENARQLASRARKRVQAVKGGTAAQNRSSRELVEAFLSASRLGDFSALLKLLDPEAFVVADDTALKSSEVNRNNGAPALGPELRGAQAIAEAFNKRAQGARLVLVDGRAGAAWIHEGLVRAVFVFATDAGRIQSIKIVMDAERLAKLEVLPIA